MNKETLRKSEDLLDAFQIAESVLEKSNTAGETLKAMQVFHTQNKQILNSLVAEGKLSSYGVKSLVDTFLTFWNESISVETEIFWNKIKERGINYVRKEPLRRALLKGRFNNVHEAMAAAKNFDLVLKSGLLESQYSQDQLTAIKQIIAEDLERRIVLLKNCLQGNKIPTTKYLRFGECMAYMNECQLWDIYFQETEIYQLAKIWKDFKIQAYSE
jgi:hypothetical protein